MVSSCCCGVSPLRDSLWLSVPSVFSLGITTRPGCVLCTCCRRPAKELFQSSQRRRTCVGAVRPHIQLLLQGMCVVYLVAHAYIKAGGRYSVWERRKEKKKQKRKKARLRQAVIFMIQMCHVCHVCDIGCLGRRAHLDQCSRSHVMPSVAVVPMTWIDGLMD